MVNFKNKTLPINRREMKRVAKAEYPAIVTVPEVVGVAIVAVEPLVVVITLDVEDVGIAIRVDYV